MTDIVNHPPHYTQGGVAKLRPGMVFSSLTLVERVELSPVATWLVRCKCGAEFRKPARRIIDDHQRGKGRQCVACGRLATNKGTQELSGSMVNGYRTNAALRNLTFNVTAQFLVDLFNSQAGKCALSGVVISLPRRFKVKKDGRTRVVRYGDASLDRIDNAIGYEPWNVWWVHKDINRIRSDFSVSEFRRLCRLVSDHAGENP